MADRSERKLISCGFVIIGLCLLTMALIGAIPPIRIIDVVLGLASVATGLVRLRNDRRRKGSRIHF
jgi:hypothetical protein